MGGQGLPWPAPGMVPWASLFLLPSWTGDEGDQALAQDWYLDGLSPPEPVEIPYSWIAGPMRMRTDKAVTYASVTKTGAGTAIAIEPADEQIDFTANTDASNDVDASNQAQFMVDYYDEPRTRLASLRFVLNFREPTEIWTLLGVQIGTRICIPHASSNISVRGAHSLSEAEFAKPALFKDASNPSCARCRSSVTTGFKLSIGSPCGRSQVP
jgi:hypothetical protein